MQIKFKAHLERGGLTFDNPGIFASHLLNFKPEDELQVVVEKIRKNRSNPQNNYYWGGVLLLISKETGHTCEELHEIFKRMFLVPYIVELNGKKIRLPGSTANLSTAEFTEHIERVSVWAASELHLNIPDPDGFIQ